MKKKNGSESGLANLRTFAAFLFFSLGISMGVMSLAALPAQRSNPAQGLAQFKPTVRYSVNNGVSPRVRDLPLVQNVPTARSGEI
jgi:hypothetical protein